ncbi:putative sulfoacetate--CoA ligase [Corynebacterium ciconiae DSM 44920]|uniref:o-succinylbenzoate--CoA ligase n=1 Tax=Corynebacterium ciconiae TaxID=227319 RepID=UPI00036C62B0|nr:putative sulfoacetate--CoA ligase [Corynebacterium ciconiae DSM 44920]
MLEALPVSPADPAAILPDLAAALAGERSLLPLPAADRARAQQLARTMRVGEPIDPEVALVMSTSGSTGTPKGALLSGENLAASAVATHNALHGPGSWVLALPAHHIAGIQVLVRSILAETTPTVLDVSRGFNLTAFASATAEARRTGGDDPLYTALVPNQLHKALESLQGIEALRLYDAILIGGGPTTDSTRAAAKRLGISVVCTYGSSETAGGCIYDGVPIEWASVKLTGTQGRIHLGGPMVARGYRNVGAKETDAFAHPGWFSTSDCGYISDGVLHVTGRLDAIISSGGLKLHPEVLEQELLNIAGVDSACVTGIPDARLGQAIVAAYSGSARVGEIIEALDHLPRWQLPKQLLRVDALPTTGPGKVDRRAVARLF